MRTLRPSKDPQGQARRIDPRSARATRKLLRALRRPLPGIPFPALVWAARELEQDLVVDLASAKRIGLPVIVLRAVSRQAEFLRVLTVREREVAKLIAQGYSNHAIATELEISIGTAKDHVHHILAKTGCSSRWALMARLAEGAL